MKEIKILSEKTNLYNNDKHVKIFALIDNTKKVTILNTWKESGVYLIDRNCREFKTLKEVKKYCFNHIEDFIKII